MTDLATLKRRRDVIKSSIAKLTTKTGELEEADFTQAIANHAGQLLKKLDALDTEFKTHHMSVIDAIENEEELEGEQRELNAHDDNITNLSLRLQTLSTSTTVPTDPGQDRALVQRRLAQLQARLIAINTDVSSLTRGPQDFPLVHLYQEQLTEFKRELSDIRTAVLSITVDDSDPLMGSIKKQDKDIFDMSVTVKRLLYNPGLVLDPPTLTPSETRAHGVKLPKIEVATFSGDLLNWKTFWEQFDISIHSRKDISDAEKLAYLRHALKDGSARSVIEGLSQSGDQYSEATESLTARYNRPRLIHQAHVRKICETPSLKDGSGKELRRLHDSVQQHLRALKSMGEEPSGAFITSMLELKLDQATMFEWQKTSQESDKVPHYKKLLEFLNLRAQASETCSPNPQERRNGRSEHKRATRQIAAHPGSVSDSSTNCVACKTEEHPLYTCPKFKGLPHYEMLSTVRLNNLCLNCFRPGHISRNCTSSNRCRCQKPHHTLLHIDSKDANSEPAKKEPCTASIVASNTQSGSNSNTLLMTCQVLVHAPDGSQVRARGLLDSGSSTSFISQRLVQSLHLQRFSKNLQISGIAGISHNSPLHSISSFHVSPTFSPSKRMPVTAVVVPRVTCDLPVQSVRFNTKWEHLSDLSLSDPDFGCPGRIDMLLGVDIYADALLQGRRKGPPGTPVAFETKFGWVLAGKIDQSPTLQNKVPSFHITVASGDDILRKFWEIEESPKSQSDLSPQERTVVQHFKENHTKTKEGRFVVPLPKNPQTKPLGESRTQAVRRFLSLEKTLQSKNQFKEFATVMEEYKQMDHAETVPFIDLQKPSEEVFYLPMHAVYKAQSTTTKIRAVFDASAKSSTGISLNDTLLVGPTVHPPLIDVLLQFRLHRIALTAEVSKMYRAIELTPSDRDLHRFVWRSNSTEPLVDYRMTRVTFGVSASAFAANMSVKQNAIDHAAEYPQAANVVQTSFYVDDCLTGANTIDEAIELQRQLHDLFAKGGFLLRKWTSSDSTVMEHIPLELRDSQPLQVLPSDDDYTKTLGIEWNANKDS